MSFRHLAASTSGAWSGLGEVQVAKAQPSYLLASPKLQYPRHAWGETTLDQAGYHVCQLVLGKPSLMRTGKDVSANKSDTPDG